MPELFPMIQPQLVVKDEPLPLYREAAWDFYMGMPIFRGGNPVTVTGIEAIKVWVWKALVTERTRYEIYTWNFGSEVETLMGQNYTTQLKQSEAARYVYEALVINPYITDITDIQVDFADGKITIEATVHTVYGEVRLNV